ncbi:unnamed protein product [Bursaphelenchus xylophilus]|uniref:(pine wood nematode) hypothetical protein n=1 Tax=Bursaphelenchus xylophilus TaxID=6326 RepID=A0A1I7SRB6_BURXY|nr:unnamed protein product [Bursaphelenchus xylophilus]CAG9102651.1 unnamed protein product [Bursaphelenchus xylophilus]
MRWLRVLIWVACTVGLVSAFTVGNQAEGMEKVVELAGGHHGKDNANNSTVEAVAIFKHAFQFFRNMLTKTSTAITTFGNQSEDSYPVGPPIFKNIVHNTNNKGKVNQTSAHGHIDELLERMSSGERKNAIDIAEENNNTATINLTTRGDANQTEIVDSIEESVAHATTKVLPFSGLTSSKHKGLAEVTTGAAQNGHTSRHTTTTSQNLRVSQDILSDHNKTDATSPTLKIEADSRAHATTKVLMPEVDEFRSDDNRTKDEITAETTISPEKHRLANPTTKILGDRDITGLSGLRFDPEIERELKNDEVFLPGKAAASSKSRGSMDLKQVTTPSTKQNKKRIKFQLPNLDNIDYGSGQEPSATKTMTEKYEKSIVGNLQHRKMRSTHEEFVKSLKNKPKNRPASHKSSAVLKIFQRMNSTKVPAHLNGFVGRDDPIEYDYEGEDEVLESSGDPREGSYNAKKSGSQLNNEQAEIEQQIKELEETVERLNEEFNKGNSKSSEGTLNKFHPVFIISKKN